MHKKLSTASDALPSADAGPATGDAAGENIYARGEIRVIVRQVKHFLSLTSGVTPKPKARSAKIIGRGICRSLKALQTSHQEGCQIATPAAGGEILVRST